MGKERLNFILDKVLIGRSRDAFQKAEIQIFTDIHAFSKANSKILILKLPGLLTFFVFALYLSISLFEFYFNWESL